MFIKKFRLQNPETSADGGGAAEVIDRGDLLETPAAEAAPTDDPKIAALAAELGVDEADQDESAADDKKGKRIPLDRHEAVLKKERERSAAMAAEIAELKKRGNVTATAEATTADIASMEASIVEMEAEYAAFLSDGEQKKATDIMAQIRKAERTMADARADLKIQVATVQAQESARYETALGRIEAAYPVLNPDSDAFDPKVEARVARLHRANQAEGMTPTAALQDAVEAILGAETTSQERATSVTPRVAKDVGAERKADAVGKTTKAAGATPPSLKATGLDSDKLGVGALEAQAVIQLSQKDFAALSEATLSKLRGDTV